MGKTFCKISLLVIICRKGPMDILTKPNNPKRKQNYLSQILLTYFSEEFLKILKNPFARLSIFPGIIISRTEESKIIFSFSQIE